MSDKMPGEVRAGETALAVALCACGQPAVVHIQQVGPTGDLRRTLDFCRACGDAYLAANPPLNRAQRRALMKPWRQRKGRK